LVDLYDPVHPLCSPVLPLLDSRKELVNDVCADDGVDTSEIPVDLVEPVLGYLAFGGACFTDFFVSCVGTESSDV
jgi:hypothetical protein